MGRDVGLEDYRFILMLTRADRTVPDARRHLETALAAGIRHIGFKDIGLPLAELRGLAEAIHAGGATSYLEVVSLDAAREIASARAARDLGVHHLMGGTRATDVLPILSGSGIRYLPFPGRIEGHPSRLCGTAAEIAASAAALAALPGVDGLDLLAYRAAMPDIPGLIAAVTAAAAPKPVIVAGSVDTPARITAVAAAGAAGFTIGTAALDGAFPGAAPDLASQLAAISQAARAVTGG